jgi:hypothetical protein
VSGYLSSQIVSAESMGASFNSSVFSLADVMGYSIQAVFTGSPNGVFKLQASNDMVSAVGDIVNWTDIASTSIAINSNGTAMWNIADVYYRWVRLVYTRTSGTGSCDAVLNARGFDA